MLYKISIRLDLLFLLSCSVHQSAGNATKRETYAFTTGTLGSVTSTKTYTYGNTNWNDLLTVASGYLVEYDSIGNPTKIYEDHGDYEMGWVLEWKGRQLMSYREYELFYDVGTYDYYSTTTYTYNADGIRTSKTVDGVKHEYILNGSQIIGEKITDGSTEKLLVYIYDESGTPVGMKYRDNTYAVDAFDHYYFEKNLQGDIIAVYNEELSLIITYKYDAWGNFTLGSGDLNVIMDEFELLRDYNPFRYRGYYYDVDTELYYLQSRYYNPSWCRFINADAIIGSGGFAGFNLFVYCANNPVMFVDPCGVCPHNRIAGEDCNICKQEKLFNELAGISTSDEPEQYYYEGTEDDIDPGLILTATTGGWDVVLSILQVVLPCCEDVFETSSNAASITFVCFDVFVGIGENVNNGASPIKIYYDIRVDVALSGTSAAISSAVGTKIGSLLGSVVCPGFGTVVGAAVGAGAGILCYYITDVWTYGTNSTLRENLKGLVD